MRNRHQRKKQRNLNDLKEGIACVLLLCAIGAVIVYRAEIRSWIRSTDVWDHFNRQAAAAVVSGTSRPDAKHAALARQHLEALKTARQQGDLKGFAAAQRGLSEAIFQLDEQGDSTLVMLDLARSYDEWGEYAFAMFWYKAFLTTEVSGPYQGTIKERIGEMHRRIRDLAGAALKYCEAEIKEVPNDSGGFESKRNSYRERVIKQYLKLGMVKEAARVSRGMGEYGTADMKPGVLPDDTLEDLAQEAAGRRRFGHPLAYDHVLEDVRREFGEPAYRVLKGHYDRQLKDSMRYRTVGPERLAEWRNKSRFWIVTQLGYHYHRPHIHERESWHTTFPSYSAMRTGVSRPRPAADGGAQAMALTFDCNEILRHAATLSDRDARLNFVLSTTGSLVYGASNATWLHWIVGNREHFR
jgi:hypothetical protein